MSLWPYYVIRQLCECLGELAYHGHRVKMYDANIDSLNSAYERIEEDKQHLRQDGLLPQLNFIVCVLFSVVIFSVLGFIATWVQTLTHSVMFISYIFHCVG